MGNANVIDQGLQPGVYPAGAPGWAAKFPGFLANRCQMHARGMEVHAFRDDSTPQRLMGTFPGDRKRAEAVQTTWEGYHFLPCFTGIVTKCKTTLAGSLQIVAILVGMGLSGCP